MLALKDSLNKGDNCGTLYVCTECGGHAPLSSGVQKVDLDPPHVRSQGDARVQYPQDNVLHRGFAERRPL